MCFLSMFNIAIGNWGEGPSGGLTHILTLCVIASYSVKVEFITDRDKSSDGRG